MRSEAPLEIEPTPPLPRAHDEAGMLAVLRESGAHLLRLHFCDLFGALRTLEVPARGFREAVSGEMTVDASAVDGTPGREETVVRLAPDPRTLALLPWREGNRRIAHLLCDARAMDGTAYPGDPRAVLRRVVEELGAEGLTARVAAEIEFFLLEPGSTGPMGDPTTAGGGSYGAGEGRGEAARADALAALEALGCEVGSAHHEAAPGQHELALAGADPLRTADALVILRHTVRAVAAAHGLEASFMPKPHARWNGSGLHTHVALLRDGSNAFSDEAEPDALSETLRLFVGGLLRHARGYTAITNPLVNSYKRLRGGHEAPTNIAWSLHNRSLLVRIPPQRGEETRIEHRLADAAANPYLALAVQLAAGLDGVRGEHHPGEPLSRSITALTARERQRLRIETVPGSLREALDELDNSREMRRVLGEHVFAHFTEAKRAEWAEYSTEVHEWEIRRYLRA